MYRNRSVDKSGQILIPSKVGMSFESDEKAHEMYNTYAGQIGFSVRNSKTKHRLDGSLCQKHLVCISQGYKKMSRHKRILQGWVVMLVFS